MTNTITRRTDNTYFNFLHTIQRTLVIPKKGEIRIQKESDTATLEHIYIGDPVNIYGVRSFRDHREHKRFTSHQMPIYRLRIARTSEAH